MATLETDLLLELIARKHQILSELCELGRRQAVLIDCQEMGELLKLLAGKQQLITALQTTERELHPFRGQSPEERRWRTPADRTRCAALLDRCQALLAEILEQEKRSERDLRLRRDEAAARLDGAHTAGLARTAYAAPHGRGLGQLDLSSEN